MTPLLSEALPMSAAVPGLYPAGDIARARHTATWAAADSVDRRRLYS